MGKKFLHIPQFAYGIIKPESSAETQGFYTTGLSRCMGFVATGTPTGPAPSHFYHLFAHVDALTSIESTYLAFKEQIPETFTIKVYLDNPESLKEYREQIQALERRGVSIEYSADQNIHLCLERDVPSPRALVSAGAERDEEIRNDDADPDGFVSYLNTQKINSHGGQFIPKHPILYHNGDRYLTVDEILAERPDIKAYMEFRDLQQIVEEFQEENKKFDSLESLMEEAALIINERRSLMCSSPAFMVTGSSLQACHQKHFIAIPINSLLPDVQHSMKSELTQMRQQSVEAASMGAASGIDLDENDESSGKSFSQ